MKTTEIVSSIENLAPLDTQEAWDCSGWQIDFGQKEIKKILLCLSVTENIINKAQEKNCDMVISHHPLFLIPFDFNKNIPIYSAHTNLDKAQGGTTDTLIEVLFSDGGMVIPPYLYESHKLDWANAKLAMPYDGGIVIPPYVNDLSKVLNSPIQKIGDFLRLVELENEQKLVDFVNLIKEKLNIENLRVVNNFNKQKIRKITFCAGSGADFIEEAKQNNADAIVTGDVKYHQALESDVIIIDIGHFESEIPVLTRLQKMLETSGVETIIADEKSPFINY